MIGMFDSKNMKHSAKSTFDGTQRVSAWISLLAVLLIYTPVASATLMAVTGACCSGDQCPIHGNHHHPAHQNGSQHSNDAPMDCDHHAHSTNEMSPCSMSCCHTVEPAAVHSHIYVMVPRSLGAPLASSLSAVLSISSAGIFRSYSPLAPPPKSSIN